MLNTKPIPYNLIYERKIIKWGKYINYDLLIKTHNYLLY